MTKLGVFVAAAAFCLVQHTFAQTSVPPLSPQIQNPANGHAYVLLTTSTWEASEAQAIAMGGHLATIRNEAEQQWIYDTFGDYGGTAHLLWIGLNDAASVYDFVWSSGEPLTYARWACGEPNNAGGVERYVAMYYPGHSAASQWNDWADRTTDPIGLPFNGVVEIMPAPAVIVQPTSLALWPGRTAKVMAAVTGATPLEYQWDKNGTNLVDGGNIYGSQTRSLTISNLAPADAAFYTVVASVASGSLTSNPVQITIMSPPLVSSYAAAVVDNQPLAYWRFNDTGNPATESLAFDSAGGFNGIYEISAQNGFNGIAGPRPPDWFGFELANSAVLMSSNGVSPTWVRVPVTPILTTNTVTFAGWIYPTVSPEPDYAGLFMTRMGTQAGLGYVANGQIGYTWNTNTTWSFQSGLVPPSGQWSFVALVIEPTQATIYLGTGGGLTNVVNGIPHGIETWGGIAEIGSDPYCDASRSFAGIIDELALFDHALTPSQVQDLYNRAFTPPAVTVNIQWLGRNLLLTWPEGMLLQADDAKGPWLSITNASSPYSLAPTAGKKFYRVKVQ